MAVLLPFKAIRPTAELAHKVAALPYDVMNREEAKEMAGENPYSFLHIDRAEIDLPDDTDPYSEIVYEKAAGKLNEMITDGIFIQDEKPCYYIYRQIMNGRSQTGLVGCASIDDYINCVIKKHELTRQDKEIDRINHVDYCDANTGPIFLTYRNEEELDRIINDWCQRKTAAYDFVSEDGISHIVWVVDDDSVIVRIKELTEAVPAFYIADGHHRSASAVKVGLKRREENPGYTGKEEFNFFLSVLFPDKDLKILDYNRVVADLNGHSAEEVLELISEKFYVEELESCAGPEEPHSMTFYLDGKWRRMKARPEILKSEDPVQMLDVSILYNEILAPVLGIGDPRTDSRIKFIGGIRGLSELQKEVDSGMAIAFAMYPTTVGELMNIADNDAIMPPKSTWFEPKLRSGLFIHKLK